MTVILTQTVWFGVRPVNIEASDSACTLERDFPEPTPEDWRNPEHDARTYQPAQPAVTSRQASPAAVRTPVTVTQHGGHPSRPRPRPKAKRPKCRGTCKLGVCTCGKKR